MLELKLGSIPYSRVDSYRRSDSPETKAWTQKVNAHRREFGSTVSQAARAVREGWIPPTQASAQVPLPLGPPKPTPPSPVDFMVMVKAYAALHGVTLADSMIQVRKTRMGRAAHIVFLQSENPHLDLKE